LKDSQNKSLHTRFMKANLNTKSTLSFLELQTTSTISLALNPLNSLKSGRRKRRFLLKDQDQHLLHLQKLMLQQKETSLLKALLQLIPSLKRKRQKLQSKSMKPGKGRRRHRHSLNGNSRVMRCQFRW